MAQLRVPDSSTSSSEDELAEYERQRAARLKDRSERRQRLDSPRWSDDNEATRYKLAKHQARQEERQLKIGANVAGALRSFLPSLGLMSTAARSLKRSRVFTSTEYTAQ